MKSSNLASAAEGRELPRSIDGAQREQRELARFVAAQSGVYELALDELRQGEKRTHWMWFVLPQLRGLGHSLMADRYGIEDSREASAYLAHPVLGPRLRECVEALLAHGGERGAAEMLGVVDAIKLQSCLTLFEAAGGGRLFAHALENLYGGERDRRTLGMLT